MALWTHLICFSSKLDFFLADGSPELNGLESHPLIGMFHTYNSELKYDKPQRSVRYIKMHLLRITLVPCRKPFYRSKGP